MIKNMQAGIGLHCTREAADSLVYGSSERAVVGDSGNVDEIASYVWGNSEMFKSPVQSKNILIVPRVGNTNTHLTTSGSSLKDHRQWHLVDVASVSTALITRHSPEFFESRHYFDAGGAVSRCTTFWVRSVFTVFSPWE